MSASLDPNIAAQYTKGGPETSGSFIDHVLNIIPDTLISPFVTGDLLQVLFVAILTGFACSRLGSFGAQVAHALESATKVLFSIIHIIVWAAPIGAFGAMAFTIGRYGVASLQPLAFLITTFYVTSLFFVFVVLGGIARAAGFSIFRFIRYFRDELFIVLGTSSSEPVLPALLEKLQKLGASRSVVGLVIPTGYSFNLDGTNIYMTLAILFLAQATNTELTFWQQMEILAIAMLTSKGASGVSGAGFITLAATLTIVPAIPIVSLAVLVGIDRFMSQCRALTNAIGNGVAALVVARWENELDRAQLARELARGRRSRRRIGDRAGTEARPRPRRIGELTHANAVCERLPLAPANGILASCLADRGRRPSSTSSSGGTGESMSKEPTQAVATSF